MILAELRTLLNKDENGRRVTAIKKDYGHKFAGRSALGIVGGSR